MADNDLRVTGSSAVTVNAMAGTARAAPVARGPGGESQGRVARLIQASMEIAATPPSGEGIAFLHTVMCQVGLPRSRVAGTHFLRQSGNAWVSMQAGLLDEGAGPVAQPLPYGPLPRLALQYVSTYAKRYKTRDVPIGDSARAFLQALGRSTSGGPRGGYTALRRQMHALAACRIQFGCGGRTFNGQLVEQFDAWLPMGDTQRSLWPGRVLLSENYFNDLLAYGVPLDSRALRALRNSALALDLYMWLAHRLHRIGPRPYPLYWKSLRDQFGQEYEGTHGKVNFKLAFLKALAAVCAVYPKAKVQRFDGGLLLWESPPPVPFSSRD